MLQFNKSEATNTHAVWLETVNTGSGYYNSIKLQYSQSYDNSNGIMDITAISTPNLYRNWLLFSNSGSDVPLATGQYDIKIYTYTGSFEVAIWGQWSDTWLATSQTWGNITGDAGVVLVDLLYSDRAWVSGSNNSSITQYVSPNENGTYITYNG